MDKIALNSFTLADSHNPLTAKAKSAASNGFESLLHGNASGRTHSAANRSSCEVLSNGHEQKAFATHVLSYIDVISVDAEKINQAAAGYNSHSYGATQRKSAPAQVNGKAVTMEVTATPSQQDVKSDMLDKKQSKASSLAPLFFANIYQKIKISLLGGSEKTLLVRDYFTNTSYTRSDFTLSGDDNKAAVNLDGKSTIKKLIHNGLEK